MSIQRVIMAANGSVPRGNLKPRNCHEAVFGWLLQAKGLKFCQPGEGGVEHAWWVVRALSEAHAENPGQPQLTGAWVAKYLYYGPHVQRIVENSTPFLMEGDVVFMGNRKMPHHSMVVVERRSTQRLARGFNNAGAFGGPFMGWDPTLRDLADASRWTRKIRTGEDGDFMANNGRCELWRISYDRIMQNIPDSLVF